MNLKMLIEHRKLIEKLYWQTLLIYVSVPVYISVYDVHKIKSLRRNKVKNNSVKQDLVSFFSAVIWQHLKIMYLCSAHCINDHRIFQLLINRLINIILNKLIKYWHIICSHFFFLFYCKHKLTHHLPIMCT